MSREIIAHCFLWKIKDVTRELNNFKNCGYTAIQLSPIQGIKECGDYLTMNDWWKTYQPLDMAIVGSKALGYKEDLIELCNRANEIGIKIIMDVVLRHTAGSNDGKLTPHHEVSRRLSGNEFFWTKANTTTNYSNRWESTNLAFGMPMLNYNNCNLQDIYIEFLQSLKDCGISGFRVDMAKHFLLKEEGSLFWENVFGKFRDMFNYAECLECDKKILDKYTKIMNVITDYHMPSDKSRAVIYIMSHDTEETWKSSKNKGDEMIIKEWESLLRDNRESHVLFYLRSFSDLWKSDVIREINNTYR